MRRLPNRTSPLRILNGSPRLYNMLSQLAVLRLASIFLLTKGTDEIASVSTWIVKVVAVAFAFHNIKCQGALPFFFCFRKHFDLPKQPELQSL
jgi:hypothetical protein